MAIIKSDASSDTLTIDATSKAARDTLYSGTSPAVNTNFEQPTTVTALPIAIINDGQANTVFSGILGALQLANYTPLLSDSFENTVIHVQRWTTNASAMSAGQSTANGLILNNTNLVAATNGFLLQSAKRMLKMQNSPLQVKIRARLWHFPNSVMELGFGDSATSAAQASTGAYWQMTATGALIPVVRFLGTEIAGLDVRDHVSLFNYYTFDVIVDDGSVIFVIQDTSTGMIISRQTIELPITAQRVFSATQLPVQVRNFIISATQAAPILYVSDIMCLMLNLNSFKPFSDSMSLNDRSSWQQPFSGAQSVTWANSAAPGSTTLANAGPGATTLGGLFQFAAVAGAATDFVLFGYAPIAPSTLVITGVSIDTWNTGAAGSAATPTVMNWALGFGSTAVSLATATTTRIPIGMNVLPINAPVGSKAESLYHTFRTPITIGQGLTTGRFIQIILRVTVGAATASQIIAGMVGIEGYFE